MERKFELVVIGTGAAGSAAAYKCRKAGWDVAIIDSRPFGGTCALRGCDPKKVLVGVAELIDWANRTEGKGVSAKGAEIDWPSLMQFKKTSLNLFPKIWRKAMPRLASLLITVARAFLIERMFKLVMIRLILICLLFACAAGQQSDPLAEFSLAKLDGQTLRSQELTDNIVVLDFWATWCENCVSEIPAFNKLEKEYGSRGVKVIGLAVQSGWASDIQKFAKQYNMRYTVLVLKNGYCWLQAGS